MQSQADFCEFEASLLSRVSQGYAEIPYVEKSNDDDDDVNQTLKKRKKSPLCVILMEESDHWKSETAVAQEQLAAGWGLT